MGTSPTVLAWGYWGWGEATRQLVERFDAVEAARGFGPPLLVDVRASRSVRANGFRGDAFEKVVGPDRYRWLQGLGNAAVATGKGSMRLVRPETATELLSLVTEAARQGRRVIYFCSCESPWRAQKCHRYLVGTTLLEAARAERSKLSVQEWPDGEPTARPVATLEVPRVALASLLERKTSWVSPRDWHPTPDLLGMPIGSLVRLAEGGRTLTAAAAPPCLVSRRWKLPLLLWPEDGDSARDVAAAVRETRQLRGMEARHA
jgi:hypothetical protein